MLAAPPVRTANTTRELRKKVMIFSFAKVNCDSILRNTGPDRNCDISQTEKKIDWRGAGAEGRGQVD
jgi:hypothetical protein